jgi:hypothetical protein
MVNEGYFNKKIDRYIIVELTDTGGISGFIRLSTVLRTDSSDGCGEKYFSPG